MLIATAVAIYGVLAVGTPLTALGGSLFLLGPLLVTAAVVLAIVVAGPLYLLGVAGGQPVGERL